MEGTCNKCAFPLDKRYKYKRVVGVTPLMHAAFNGYEQCVVELIEAGADVNTIDDEYRSALMFATINDHHNCVHLLLKAGAAVNSTDDECRSVLMYATINDHHNCVTLLLNAGADVNLTDKYGDNVLMYAAFAGQIECLELAIQAGVDVNRRNSNGETALMRVAMFGHPECIPLLVVAGADVNMANVEGETPLDVLLKAGADVNRGDNMGFTALHHVIRAPNTVSHVKRLLRAGADVNKQNSDGHNAFLYGAKRWLPSFENGLVLLFLAGSVWDSHQEKSKEIHNQIYSLLIPGYRKIKSPLYLKHLCREAIRKHLIELDPHAHLYNRIPQLGFPSSLTSFVLYNMSLETKENDKDNNTDYGFSALEIK